MEALINHASGQEGTTISRTTFGAVFFFVGAVFFFARAKEVSSLDSGGRLEPISGLQKTF